MSSDGSPYEASDVLTCSADGDNPTYEWSGTNGGSSFSSTSSTVTLLEGEFCLICTATVNSDPDCSACAFLCDSARGMYQQDAVQSLGEPHDDAVNLVASHSVHCFPIK